MNIHLVGLLVCDEVQNLANAHKGGQTVMTELVSACNELKVPILFIGTNKATKVLSLDFRQSRRASGHGLEPWDRLHHQVPEGEPNEWQEFVQVMWVHQWTRNPVELTHLLADTLYHYSQGVIDVAIKLFASAQARAILDGTEMLTPDLIADVYRREMKLLHPMIEALRDNDLERLAAYDDVAPIGMADIIDSAIRKAQAKTSPLYRSRPGDKSFSLRLAASLSVAGFPEEEAEVVAEQVDAAGNARNLVEGVQEAIESLTAPKPLRRKKGSRKTKDALPTYEDRPLDYRRALSVSDTKGIPMLSAFRTLSMTRPIEDLVALD
jgi:hypothetical protein